jgi:hypothetical protein
MKLGVLSDIRGNRIALEAVVEDGRLDWMAELPLASSSATRPGAASWRTHHYRLSRQRYVS